MLRISFLRGVTVTSTLAVTMSLVPFAAPAVTVIVAVPSDTPFTLPSALTVATDVSLLLQDTVRSVASAGSSVTCS